MDLRDKDRAAGQVAGAAGDSATLKGPHSQTPAPAESTATAGHDSGGDSAAIGDSLSGSFLYRPHPYPGRLIAVEGIDGSGKSTQLLLLERWLRTRGYPVHFTEWNSSRLVRRAMSRGKKKNLLTPTTFSLLHAVDFADRLTYQILPPIKAGMIVLADRYVYTAFARDVARGVHPQWVRQVYRFALRPDLTLYFRIPIEVSLERLLAGRAKLKYHEAGMDVTRSADPVESFSLFQSRVLAIYDELTQEFGLKPVDAAGEIPVQQKLVRKMVQEILRDYDRLRARGNHGLAVQAR